ncbi:hypothetical protein DUI87_00206 [Hirundo rustica rustica]|uniref:Uncharacterized protein n=1 Tax=Hirundo rustica rustica TaxID=333673 RepID=A0A3M0LCN8_HIRRU|nr:hypothetical protein DUI87_00206 [Hirundo rustica rustica]
MLRRQARERREYLQRRAREQQQQRQRERRESLRRALDENRLLPTELRHEALALQKELEFDFEAPGGEKGTPKSGGRVGRGTPNLGEIGTSKPRGEGRARPLNGELDPETGRWECCNGREAAQK